MRTFCEPRCVRKVAGWLVSATVPVAYLEVPRRRGQLFALVMLGTALVLGLTLAYFFGALHGTASRDATASAAEAIGAGKQVEPLHSPLVEANAVTAALSDASLSSNAGRNTPRSSCASSPTAPRTNSPW